MTNTKKMTKADYFKQIMANYSLTEDEKAFVQHELDLLAKKNSGEKKKDARQLANDSIKDAILDFMEVGKQYTVSDFIKTVPACAGLSNPKVSALVKQLKDDGLVVRTEEKRRAYFSKVE